MFRSVWQHNPWGGSSPRCHYTLCVNLFPPATGYTPRGDFSFEGCPVFVGTTCLRLFNSAGQSSCTDCFGDYGFDGCVNRNSANKYCFNCVGTSGWMQLSAFFIGWTLKCDGTYCHIVNGWSTRQWVRVACNTTIQVPYRPILPTPYT